MSRAISYQTYKTYAKKYNIPLFKLKYNPLTSETTKIKKTLKELQKEIYKFESINVNLIDCLYFEND
jgi:hypothetical protein